MLRFLLLVSLFVSCTTSGRTGVGRSGLLLISGGTIITLDEARPEVEAVLVREGHVSAMGTLEQVLGEPGAAQAERYDLEGNTLYPGFVDGHAHLVGIGQQGMQVNLMGATSLQNVLDRLRHFTDENPLAEGAWLVGRGWDQNDWPELGFPDHRPISRMYPHHPVVLTRVDGHALWANRRAMELAGVDANTPDPEGGKIHRDAAGAPTGIFVDNAKSLILRHLPAMDAAQREQAVRAAAQALQRAGIVAIHDAGIDRETVAICQRLAAAGELGIRVYGMVPGYDQARLDAWLAAGPLLDPTGQVTVRAIKLYADGALGSRGAALLEDYRDDPGNRGLLVTDPARIQAVAGRALEAGFQVCTHAIGDRANRLVLDAYEQAFTAHRAGGGSTEDRRFRIEHAQVIAPEDLPRFRRLGVIPAMQTQHQTSDMPWAEDRLGPRRIRGAYAWRSLLDSGVVICGGSDAPVERLDPVASIRAAVTRADRQGVPAGGWYPEESMTRREALLQLTRWPAWASFDEALGGVIRPGARAEFTILDRDILAVPEPDLAAARVAATIFAGEVVWVAPPRRFPLGKDLSDG